MEAELTRLRAQIAELKTRIATRQGTPGYVGDVALRDTRRLFEAQVAVIRLQNQISFQRTLDAQFKGKRGIPTPDVRPTPGVKPTSSTSVPKRFNREAVSLLQEFINVTTVLSDAMAETRRIVVEVCDDVIAEKITDPNQYVDDNSFAPIDLIARDLSTKRERIGAHVEACRSEFAEFIEGRQIGNIRAMRACMNKLKVVTTEHVEHVEVQARILLEKVCERTGTDEAPKDPVTKEDKSLIADAVKRGAKKLAAKAIEKAIEKLIEAYFGKEKKDEIAKVIQCGTGEQRKLPVRIREWYYLGRNGGEKYIDKRIYCVAGESGEKGVQEAFREHQKLLNEFEVAIIEGKYMGIGIRVKEEEQSIVTTLFTRIGQLALAGIRAMAKVVGYALSILLTLLQQAWFVISSIVWKGLMTIYSWGGWIYTTVRDTLGLARDAIFATFKSLATTFVFREILMRVAVSAIQSSQVAAVGSAFMLAGALLYWKNTKDTLAPEVRATIVRWAIMAAVSMASRQQMLAIMYVSDEELRSAPAMLQIAALPLDTVVTPGPLDDPEGLTLLQNFTRAFDTATKQAVINLNAPFDDPADGVGVAFAPISPPETTGISDSINAFANNTTLLAPFARIEIIDAVANDEDLSTAMVPFVQHVYMTWQELMQAIVGGNAILLGMTAWSLYTGALIAAPTAIIYHLGNRMLQKVVLSTIADATILPLVRYVAPPILNYTADVVESVPLLSALPTYIEYAETYILDQTNFILETIQIDDLVTTMSDKFGKVVARETVKRVFTIAYENIEVLAGEIVAPTA